MSAYEIAFIKHKSKEIQEREEQSSDFKFLGYTDTIGEAIDLAIAEWGNVPKSFGNLDGGTIWFTQELSHTSMHLSDEDGREAEFTIVKR